MANPAYKASCSRPRPSPFEVATQALSLSSHNRVLLEQRYVPLIRQMQARAFRLALFFHAARITITAGSLVVPALLSIQYTEGSTSDQSLRIYWTTWVISLLVTMCNGLLTLFKLDKRYYLVHTTMEQLVSEGWQFLQLTAKYSGFYTPGIPATHENQFIFFCHAVEKIRMRQIEEEYYKLSELHAQHAGQGQHQSQQQPPRHPETNLTQLIPPTPLQGELARLPPDIQQALQQLSRNTIEDGSTGSRQQKENKESEENRKGAPMPM